MLCAELQEEPICCRLQWDLAAVGRRGPVAQQGEGEPDDCCCCCGVWREEEEVGEGGRREWEFLKFGPSPPQL